MSRPSFAGPDTLVSILVHLPGGAVISVDRVGPQVTVGSLLARLIGLSSVEVTGTPQLVSLSSSVVPNEDFLEETEYELVFFPEKSDMVKAFFFTLLFFAIHISAVLSWQLWSTLAGILVYVGLLYLMIICIVVLKPTGKLFLCSSLRPKENPVVDFLWLLVRSFLPSFRLEQILLHE
jgi:hypothetical protein